MILPILLTEPGWREVLQPLFDAPGFAQLEGFIEAELNRGRAVYPPLDSVFFALNQLPPSEVRVVILGQDPYHQPNQAHGLCFSVPQGIRPPPSLQNIFKELKRSTGRAPASPNLAPWVAQGVLLLNTVLTVTASKAGSHQGKGWEPFTDRVISHLSGQSEPVIFLLWGGFARSKKALIDRKNNLILETSHPSPLSAYRGFMGCNHFSLVNQFLSQRGERTIEWS